MLLQEMMLYFQLEGTMQPRTPPPAHIANTTGKILNKAQYVPLQFAIISKQIQSWRC